jgi:hypothetical protein
MARWRRGALVLALAACVAVQASPAAAEGEPETGAFGAFRLKGSNGFSIFVLAVSRPQFKHGETLVVVGRRGEAAIYFAPAKVTPTTIDADLGPLGEIAVEFMPSGPPKRVHARCKEGGSVTYEPGAWVGTIDFEGEEGFTRGTTGRTKAIVSPFLDAGCGGTLIGESMGSREPGARLVARSAANKHSIYLQANKNHQDARVYLETSIEERRPGLVVSREVAGYFPAGSLGFDSPLRTATLAPPAPFAGHATFHRNAKAPNRWTGNLSVDFPGQAGVPLAGERFKATLIRAKRTESTTLYDRLARPSLFPWPSTRLPLLAPR